ncbi:anthranilate synthase, partial [candidate division MSBL1 archaeon SCGC-AAA382F02]
MKILVIDNYDSFVYNLVQYIGELGAEPIVFRNDADLGEVKHINPDKILISPGPKRPEDAGVSKEVARELGPRIPTLGVCLGHQVVVHVFGGEVKQADRLMHGKTSMIDHDGGPLYEGIPSPFEATRYHSLAVDRTSLPEDFR